MLEARLPPIERMRAGIPRTLADAIGRGLSRDPEDRTFSAGEMVELLRAHADMELAHAELITRLGRVQSMVGEARGLLSQSAPTPPIGVPAALPETLRSSRWSLHTPRGVTIANANANMESLPPIEGHPPSAPPSRSVRSASAAGVLTAVGVLGLVFAVASNLRSPAQGAAASVDAPPASVSHPAPAPPSSAVAVPAPASAPVSVPPPASSLGAIIPPPAARHHRIWIDGEVAAWSQGPSLHVPCGNSRRAGGERGRVSIGGCPVRRERRARIEVARASRLSGGTKGAYVVTKGALDTTSVPLARTGEARQIALPRNFPRALATTFRSQPFSH